MKALLRFMVFLMALFAAGIMCGAEDCNIVNGSFEDDGYIADIIVTEPNEWDVNVPADKFAGYVFRDWVTEGLYNLTIHSWRATFEPGDVAKVSQQMELSDVNEIIFDLRLDTDRLPWDPNVFKAVLLIDSDVVWDSNSASSDIRGEYLNLRYEVGDKYRAPGLHELSLGLKSDAGGMLWERYYTNWDFIRCTLYCGGGSLLTGDFNHDCFVDVNDLQLMADFWLAEVEPYSRYNLSGIDDGDPNGIVNVFDYAIFADDWLGSSLVQEQPEQEE